MKMSSETIKKTQVGELLLKTGHVHDYCSTFPMQYNKKVNSDFNSPKGPVHITEGNGGVPGVVGTYTLVVAREHQ